MEEGTKSMQIHTPQLDLPELRHRIQSLLSPEEAGRTCVLSKSWLHAFSTMPTLKFTKCAYVNKKQENRYMESIDRTLLRYHNDNLPIKRIDLHIDTKHPKVLHPAVKWIQLLASKSCRLGELSLTIRKTLNYSFTIPDEIFSCENLNTLSLRVEAEVRMNENPMIKCSSLRVLELELLNVGISEVVLNNLLSTCTLLEKIDITCDQHLDLKTIKVKHLLYLQELKIRLIRERRRGNYYSFTIPDEIFSCENLNTLSLRVENADVRMNENLMIRCSSLRVLELEALHGCISEVVLNNLLSNCSLLEKINISWDLYHDLKTIKVKNLLYLHELKIQPIGENSILEIYNVPSVRCLSFYHPKCLLVPFKRDLFRSMRELSLGGVIMDTAFSNMIKSEFPVLEVLTLEMISCTLETLDFTCVSLKRLSLSLREKVQINIQVYASKLLYFCYDGCKMPGLFFPATSPEHIKLGLILENLDDLNSFFLDIKEILNLSSTFDIEINDETGYKLVPEKFDIDDLRRRTAFPARNVQQLSFKTGTTLSDTHFPKYSLIFQALFSIFYPNYLRVYHVTSNTKVKNIMYKLIVGGKLDKSILDLKDVQIKNHVNGQWETLTTDYYKSWNDHLKQLSDEFKLNWCS